MYLAQGHFHCSENSNSTGPALLLLQFIWFMQLCFWSLEVSKLQASLIWMNLKVGTCLNQKTTVLNSRKRLVPQIKIKVEMFEMK